jgi:hypothetical protein
MSEVEYKGPFVEVHFTKFLSAIADTIDANKGDPEILAEISREARAMEAVLKELAAIRAKLPLGPFSSLFVFVD